jgi:hypothetical protein
MNRDTSTINSTKRSSVRCGQMEQRLFIGISQRNSSSWTGDMSKTQEGLADPRFQCSDSNSECTRGDTTCLCSMHCRGHAHSCNNRVLHFDKSTPPGIPSLAMGTLIALRRSKAGRVGQALLFLAALTAARSEVIKLLDW